MDTFRQRVMTFLRREDGPTSVEYAVMLALIILVCFSAITSLGANTNKSLSSSLAAIKAAS
jgi:pilus assembly protein Flp/PilA